MRIPALAIGHLSLSLPHLCLSLRAVEFLAPIMDVHPHGVVEFRVLFWEIRSHAARLHEDGR
jgi:hypothetical protein